jgi:hypothetical protein
MSSEPAAVQIERRQHPQLRAIFEEAYARVESCFDPQQTWGGLPLEHFAYRMLREAYPQFSSQETRLLVGALLRVFRERRAGRATATA